MAVVDTYVFPGFLTPVLTQLFLPKPPTTFFTCFCRGERRKYAGKKTRLNRGSNSPQPGHESDTLTTEPPGRGKKTLKFTRYMVTHIELIVQIISTLSQTTDFRLFQMERVCRRQIRIWWKWQKILQTGRKHCGKRRNCSSRAISPFPTVFSKDLNSRHVKTRACLGKG